jgi:hypothetical protein
MPDPATGFAPDPPPRGRNPSWREAQAGPSRGTLAAATLLLMTAVAGVAIGLLLMPRGRVAPRLVSWSVPEYESAAWPPHPVAAADARRLSEAFTAADKAADSYRQADRFRNLLDWVAGKQGVRADDLAKDGDIAGRPLVLHLVALGATRGGEVYVLPADADPLGPDAASPDAARWVKLADVLQAVEDSPARGKLLILDLAPATDPFGGELAGDLSTKLDAALEAARGKAVHFPVLTACGPGEASLACGPERCSAFAYFLSEGVKGRADGFPDPGHRDGSVTLRELHDSVAATVGRWAKVARGLPQTPRLYLPAEADAAFEVAYHAAPPGDRAAPPGDRADPPGHAPYPAELTEAWGAFDAARRDGSARLCPVADAKLLGRLRIADRAWADAGSAESDGGAWRRLKDGHADLLKSLSAGKAVADTGRAADTAAKPPAPALLAALDAYVAAAAKPDADAKLEAFRQLPATPGEVVAAVWQRATESRGPTEGQMRAWAAAMPPKQGEAEEAGEASLIRTLAARNFTQEQGLSQFPGDAAAALIAAQQASGELAAAGREGFALVAGPAEAAASRAARGRTAFSAAGSTEAINKVAADLLAPAAAECRAVRDRLLAWRAADALLDAAAGRLRDAPFDAFAADGPACDAWLAAAGAAADFADKLQVAEARPPVDPAAFAGEKVELERRLRALPAPPAADAAEKLLKDAPPRPAPRPADRAPLLALLDRPGVNADGRKLLWAALAKLDAELHAAALAAIDADPAAGGLKAPADADAGAAARRAKLSAALLRLAGLPRRFAVGPGAVPPDVADGLRTAWLADLPALAERVTKGRDWFAAGRIALAAPPPWAARGLPAAARLDPNPRLARATADAEAHRAWLAAAAPKSPAP